MIQARDIRIGNYLQSGEEAGKIIRVEEIYRVHPNPDYFIEWTPAEREEEASEKKYEFENDYALLSDFTPVALTPQILSRCGFEVEQELEEWINYKLPSAFHPHDNGFYQKEEQWFRINHISREIYHLHGLQNVCFYLIGAELAIDFTA